MARTRKPVDDNALLGAALEGLELQKQRIEDQIREVRSRLGLTSGQRGRPPAAKTTSTPAVSKATGKRSLSDAARKRIAAAQKRRWAEYRKSAASGQ